MFKLVRLLMLLSIVGFRDGPAYINTSMTSQFENVILYLLKGKSLFFFQ